MTATTQAQDVLDCYRQNMAGRGHGGWQALAQILGTSRGAAWEIAHGKRTMTPDQELRWTLYRNIGNPNVQVRRITTCPTCGKLHKLDDCHGAHVQIVRRKQPRRIQDMTTAALRWAILNREEMTI